MSDFQDKTNRSETTLDPDDWSAFRRRAHDMLDQAIDKMENAAAGRVWTPVPDALRRSLSKPLPVDGSDPEAVSADLEDFLAHGVGNTHPRFFGWVHGAGTPAGLIAGMAEAAMNANTGGRDHVAIEVERQVTRWMRELFGFPEGASGLVVSGTSMATLVALKAARDAAVDYESRSRGLKGRKLVGYTSVEAHSCNARAFDMLGLGTDALRRVPVDAQFRLDPSALQAAIAADRAAGHIPFAVIATAGTVNTGSIDDLKMVGEIARKEGLWFHIDGAFAASGIMSERLAPLLDGIDRADSIAFDFHKWAHVNYDAGFVMVRDANLQIRAFSDRPDYLKRADRGLAAGSPWPVDLGPELSRGFRALKVWAQFAEYGTKKIGAAITRNCDQVEYLARLVEASPQLEMLAPVASSICCFRFVSAGLDPKELDTLNEEIVMRLQESGVAAPSTTRIGDKLTIRVNITNHRTRFSDLDLLVNAIEDLGRTIAEEAAREAL